MTAEDLNKLTIEWAKERNITNPHTQALKLVEELGETISELNHGRDGDAFEDGIGDVMVSLAVFAHITGKDLFRCWEAAYNEIKNRYGKTINGNFLKDEEE